MISTKWIPVVEDMPPINQIILLEFGGNEYLGLPYHTVILPAYLTQSPYSNLKDWVVFAPPDSPYPSQMAVSSSHIWTELPTYSCEAVY